MAVFQAHISFKPTVTQQRKDPKLEDTLLDGDFLIRYDVKRSITADDIQVKVMLSVMGIILVNSRRVFGRDQFVLLQ